MSIVYLNGQFVAQENASVSILDRGFLFGDGIYEVIPVYAGHIFSLHEHLIRLQRSLQAIKMISPLTDEQWSNILHELLVLNNKQQGDQCIYIQITRGAESNRNHLIPTDIEPTVLAICLSPKHASYEELSQGFCAITLDDRRRYDCSIKSINLLPNVLAYQQAHDAGCAEAIFIRDQQALEGTSSNLFIVKNGVLQTPPLSPHILAGITRSFILDLAKQHQIPMEEIPITEKMLRAADEIWLTGSLKQIYPIITLDDKPVGTGKVGPLWHTIMHLYQNFIHNTVNQKQQRPS
jgi:D-alanine transaminase